MEINGNISMQSSKSTKIRWKDELSEDEKYKAN